jgi:DNA-binding transcriptional LysR family regulator
MRALILDDLLLFARVATLGTLSAVARERNAPVSQVSRALVRIERACGARLIHRSTHGLALTPEGETFLAYCQRMAGTLEELEGDFAAQAGAPSGLVRVAASTVVAQYQLVPSLPGLRNRYPALRVELEVSDRLVDMARDGIDIAIRTTVNLPDTVIARRIGTLGRALYATPDYLARAGTPSHPDDLRQHQLITNSAVGQPEPVAVCGGMASFTHAGDRRRLAHQRHRSGRHHGAAGAGHRPPGDRGGACPWWRRAGWCRCWPTMWRRSRCRSMRSPPAPASACPRSRPPSTTGPTGSPGWRAPGALSRRSARWGGYLSRVCCRNRAVAQTR